MRPLKVIKNRSDIGAGTRGSDMGIDALEIAAINAENDFFNRYPFIDVPTHNESIYDKVNNTFAKRINFVAEQCERLCDVTSMVLRQQHFPLVISGDHSSALGTLAGITHAHPGKTVAAIWIDAHADLHTPLSSPSGNIHGMPLAAALGLDNEKYGVNTIDEATKKSWDQIKALGGDRPKIKPEHLLYFGLRSTEEAEDNVIEDLGIRTYAVHEIRYRSMAVCLQEAIESLKEVDLIYITFDVDSMDCDLISKGTGTPVSKGFDPAEIKQLIQGFISTDKVVCLEVCEINPLLDEKGNKMAETAFEIVNEIFG
ncbi:arginase [Flavobacteriaceae bacterium]|nr:arginase [Flavobacteriaceae bacterium]MDA9985188.1 arginase [Flavobacteriaceae bacterium]